MSTTCKINFGIQLTVSELIKAFNLRVKSPIVELRSHVLTTPIKLKLSLVITGSCQILQITPVSENVKLTYEQVTNHSSIDTYRNGKLTSANVTVHDIVKLDITHELALRSGTYNHRMDYRLVLEDKAIIEGRMDTFQHTSFGHSGISTLTFVSGK